MKSTKQWVVAKTAEVLELDEAEVTSDSRWLEDLEADSVDLIEVANAAEAEFDVVLDEADLYDVTTVGQLADLVDRIRAGA